MADANVKKKILCNFCSASKKNLFSSNVNNVFQYGEISIRNDN